MDDEFERTLREKFKKFRKFYKKNKTDKIWWLYDPLVKGEWIFSFDKKHQFNMFADYPYNLSKEQKEIFDKENPFWKDFFSDRQL